MAVTAADQTTYVVTLEAVRWAIGDLKGSRIHPFFLAYLHLRQHAAEAGTTVITPRWDEVGELLRVKGGPPGKPYYRPFWHGNVDDASRYWLNPNIAGSYAPSSLRTVPRQVIDTVGSEFVLLPDHAALAAEHLLFGEQISAVALAAFLFRDFGFTSDEEPGADDLIAALRRQFRFEDDGDFDVLFRRDHPAVVGTWFEAAAAAPGVE